MSRGDVRENPEKCKIGRDRIETVRDALHIEHKGLTVDGHKERTCPPDTCHMVEAMPRRSTSKV
jgi:hypothetical protein